MWGNSNGMSCMKGVYGLYRLKVTPVISTLSLLLVTSPWPLDAHHARVFMSCRVASSSVQMITTLFLGWLWGFSIFPPCWVASTIMHTQSLTSVTASVLVKLGTAWKYFNSMILRAPHIKTWKFFRQQKAPKLGRCPNWNTYSMWQSIFL